MDCEGAVDRHQAGAHVADPVSSGRRSRIEANAGVDDAEMQRAVAPHAAAQRDPEPRVASGRSERVTEPVGRQPRPMDIVRDLSQLLDANQLS